MPVLADPRHEAVARRLALGETLMPAYRAAGLSGGRRHAVRLASLATVVERVAELAKTTAGEAERAEWSGSREVATVIDKLVEYAARAAELNSAAAHVAARAYLVEVARLKMQIYDVGPVERELTEDEWVAKYGNPAPPSS